MWTRAQLSEAPGSWTHTWGAVLGANGGACALALLSGRLGFLDSGCSDIFLCDLGGAVLLNVSFLQYKQRRLSRGFWALAVGQVPSDSQAHSHHDPPAARGPIGDDCTGWHIYVEM